MGGTVGAVATGGLALIPGVGAGLEDVTGIDFGQEGAADRALAGQQAAARDANSTQLYMFNQQRADAQPWRDAGAKALTGLQNSDYQRDFSVSDFQQDPGYQFRMDEANKALERSSAARGGLTSGRFMKELMRQNQGMASEEYNNAYNRFNADRDRRFNRLSSIAGVGQTANSQIAQAGQNYANAYSNNIQGAANANAAVEMGRASQLAGLVGQGAQLATAGMKYCDERLKTNIKPVTKEDLAEMKSHLKAYSFNYKSPIHGSGDYVGVMAQDLEKSKLGRTLVYEDAGGNKQIDLARVLMLFLATMAEG